MKVTHAIEGTTPEPNFLEDTQRSAEFVPESNFLENTRRSAEFEPEANFLEDPRGSTKNWRKIVKEPEFEDFPRI